MYDHVLLNVSITTNTPFLSTLYINKYRDKLTNQQNIFQGKLFCNYLNFSYFNANDKLSNHAKKDCKFYSTGSFLDVVYFS